MSATVHIMFVFPPLYFSIRDYIHNSVQCFQQERNSLYLSKTFYFWSDWLRKCSAFSNQSPSVVMQNQSRREWLSTLTWTLLFLLLLMQLFRAKKLTNLLRFMLRVDGSSLKMQLFRDKKLTNLLRFMLRVVGSSLKMVKFFSQHFCMLHDVVLVWPRSCFVRVGLRHPTCCKILQQGGQTCATCCAQQCRAISVALKCCVYLAGA